MSEDGRCPLLPLSGLHHWARRFGRLQHLLCFQLLLPLMQASVSAAAFAAAQLQQKPMAWIVKAGGTSCRRPSEAQAAKHHLRPTIVSEQLRTKAGRLHSWVKAAWSNYKTLCWVKRQKLGMRWCWWAGWISWQSSDGWQRSCIGAVLARIYMHYSAYARASASNGIKTRTHQSCYSDVWLSFAIVKGQTPSASSIFAFGHALHCISQY